MTPLARGAAVLKYVQDPSVRGNADLVRFLCVFNMYNWQYVPEDLRGDEALYRAMLASPWNAPEAVQAKIPPLVLQLGGEDDCKNKDRVLAAVKHSSFNIIYVHEDLHGNPEVVAWAGAPREVTAITAEEAAHFDAEYQAILHKKPPEDGRGGNEHDFNMLLAAESFMQGHMKTPSTRRFCTPSPRTTEVTDVAGCGWRGRGQQKSGKELSQYWLRATCNGTVGRTATREGLFSRSRPRCAGSCGRSSRATKNDLVAYPNPSLFQINTIQFWLDLGF